MKNTDIMIAQAVVGDAEKILELQKLAFQSEALLYNDFNIEPLKQSPAEIKADFNEYLFLKAVFGGRIIGSVKGRMKDETSCWIGRLIVHPDFQDRGIGTMLMGEIEGRFKNAKRYELATGHKSLRNIHLYEKLGFKIFKKENKSDNITFVFMEKNK